MNVFPNPSNDVLHIETILNENNTLTISLTDIQGHTIQTRTQKATKGSNVVRINTNALNAGMYMINIKGDNFSTTQKVSIIH
ncbi:MAG: T9SS type A sorting domain-containing protein [Chitinophagaceae bacterium]